MTSVVSNLWFAKEAREAVDFYVSLVPNSAITRISTLPAESPSGPPDSVKIIEFMLGNQEFLALEAGPLDPFNHAFSIMIQCDSQEEIDRLWNAILENGGEPEQCGWIRDRWGLCWQIAPRALGDMVAHSDRARAKRATEAMLGMVKLDIAELERAFHAQE
ncbi:VOC family protein [Ensifer adhaerens]|uniref:VOC family protein n=1 Tax=Ensifer adhaerens TaxID=106592 RepID=UPI00098FCBC3|nr:VOC family protein [Ensifer adhaerens]